MFSRPSEKCVHLWSMSWRKMKITKATTPWRTCFPSLEIKFYIFQISNPFFYKRTTNKCLQVPSSLSINIQNATRVMWSTWRKINSNQSKLLLIPACPILFSLYIVKYLFNCIHQITCSDFHSPNSCQAQSGYL